MEQQHISKLYLDLRDIPYQANRALEIGCKLFNLAFSCREMGGWAAGKLLANSLIRTGGSGTEPGRVCQRPTRAC